MKIAVLSAFLCATSVVQGFVGPSHFAAPRSTVHVAPLEASKGPDGSAPHTNFVKTVENAFKTALIAATFALSTTVANPLPAHASDSAKIATCLFKKCRVPLAKCVANPKCLANVICINTCNGKEDESGCQIQCGNLWENDVVGEFNKCAVSDMSCVPQKQDDGSYPVPDPSKLVQKYNTNMWNGRWYITAGQNELFDIFPCQVHFFTETKPGTFFGKLNWRIEEPDGEFFTRDAIQQFVQDPKQPAHLVNHDNEYLHYKDDWYILDYEYDDNPDGVPPFAFVYYRGSNDAWDGYGGAFVYTRAAKLPEELLPRLRDAAKKVNFDFDKDFVATDNSCQIMDPSERLMRREKFAGKVALQSEKQVQAAATLVRGNAMNGVKAQSLFVKQEIQEAGKAFEELSSKTVEFEQEIVGDAEKVVKELVK
jgi:violaxanthin de-epoxidase